MKKYYKIAGLTVEMDSYGRTVEQALPYETEASEAQVVIENATPAFHEKYPQLTEDEREYLYTGMSFYKQLILFDGMMLHSSAVVVDGRAYLFTAPSGTGKSTHTSLYLREFGERAYILNDDKPAIRLEDGIFYAYGTPWSGKTDQNVNARVPLGGICVLARGENNEISRLGARESLLGIYSQTIRPRSVSYANRVLDLMEKLVEAVPVWALRCNMEPEAVRVSFEAMSREI